jgi:hypothetical protein
MYNVGDFVRCVDNTGFEFYVKINAMYQIKNNLGKSLEILPNFFMNTTNFIPYIPVVGDYLINHTLDIEAYLLKEGIHNHWDIYVTKCPSSPSLENHVQTYVPIQIQSPLGWKPIIDIKPFPVTMTPTILPNGSIVNYTYPNFGSLYMNSTGNVGISTTGCATGLATMPVNTKPICNHQFVNVGFTSIKMVCKHCDMEQPKL